MKRVWLLLLALLLLSACERVQLELSLDDYPAGDTPYFVEEGDFWLVHTPEGQLLAFAPVSPDYNDSIDVDECRYHWNETLARFIDPCSGDEWELDGRLNLEHSTELWSNRDLDQYDVAVQDDQIHVTPGQKITGAVHVNEN